MALAGDGIRVENASWSFGGGVSDAFDEHVLRSVPLYAEGHDLIARTADFFLSDGSLCWELGCSTGSLLIELAKRHGSKNVRLRGVDIEASMVLKAKERCASYPSIELQQGDILDLDLEAEAADMIAAYYTIQFIRPRNRQVVVDRIYQSLNWGGAFFFFEKVRAPDARFQDITSALYVDHKLEQGYSAEEIVGKARSLKGVLEPFSTEGNLGVLRRAGFVDIVSIFKFVCFEGLLAIK